MAGQEQQRREHHRDDEAPEAVAPQSLPPIRDAEREEDLDALLDEIDGVLETNAQEFVHSFVQKGGQ